MLRLLVLVVVAVLAFLLWRQLRRALDRSDGRYPPSAEPPTFEPTARCARCGTHVPAPQLDAAGLCGKCRAS